ncbi:unnamed protein product [Haemonchus placei]|uniref:Integrase_H2C2 domain-containing protein n=1 Tax=Haemonchus placei TaxID=6290 RepID=A0A0N4WS83_HAEPC|nr:unnamed protein product [Haemonchus placei]
MQVFEEGQKRFYSVAYCSHTLSGTERRWSTVQIELVLTTLAHCQEGRWDEKKTLAKALRKYYWMPVYSGIHKWCDACMTCQMLRPPNPAYRERNCLC